jgi:hypothetical protein
LGFGSKDRYESLTPGAVAVAQFVAGHLNTETNCYSISQKTLEAKLGFTRGTIVKSLKDLVAWGVFIRERENKEKPYTYRLAIECPVDCERLEIHLTPSELARWSKKQTTPLSKNQDSPLSKFQASGGLVDRQLIETYKPTNKKMNRAGSSCFSCSGVFETLSNGNKEIIHAEDCSQLITLMGGQAWNITQGEIGSAWASLDSRERQIANYLSLSKGLERKAKKAEDELEAERNQEGRFGLIIVRLEYDHKLTLDPLLRKWLDIVYRQRRGDLPTTFTDQAIKYQKLGWHLKPDGDWREGAWISKESFIESEGSND